jgi:hypothetical protein
MCTVSFVPRAGGYYLAMNRDEKIARGPATPPARVQLGTVSAIYPRDVEGGTWIGVNEQGIAFALLNSNEAQPVSEKRRSRGDIIPALISLSSLDEVRRAMPDTILHGVLPFRLIAISSHEQRVDQWAWDQQRRDLQSHDWKPQHWFSSSLSDQQAAQWRGAVCQTAWSEKDAGSLSWLRRLHASHENGAFSVCVHRDGVKTVSYTELICTPDIVQCDYSSGSPCHVEASRLSLTTARPMRGGC